MSARKILVVDDNDNVRSFLVLLLEESGGYETLDIKNFSTLRSNEHRRNLAPPTKL
jgi:CheY-like chemotaxis protein